MARSEGGNVTGPDEFVKFVHQPFLAAFPDLRIVVERIIAGENDAAVLWSASGTHTGPFLQLPVSHRKVTFSGMTWFSVRHGKIVDGGDRYNLHALIGYLSAGTISATVLAA